MNQLWPLARHPLFVLGVAIRVALIAGMAPMAIDQWYAPFLDASVRWFSLDPWSAWLDAGGTAAAFPYGYASWLVFLPLTVAARAAGWPVGLSYSVTLLLIDVAMLLALDRMASGKRNLLLALYWLSPLVILATYALGFNDLWPTLLLVAAIESARRARLRLSGALLAGALSAKFSMVIALPFFAVYLVHRRTLRSRSAGFALSFAGAALVVGLPFLLSPGAMQMLAGNPEMVKVYQFALSFGGATSVYLLPLAYMLILYFTWRIRRMNFEIFQASMGVAFLALVLMTPAAPGWFLWCVPFLYLYQLSSGRMAVALVATFTFLYIVHTMLATPLQSARDGVLDLSLAMRRWGFPPERVGSLVHTAMVGFGVILAARIWREAVGRNDYFRLSRKPFVLGIAGDSGAGKDTFAQALVGLFGRHSVVKLSGDDYHVWDRQKPMWQVMTHLNPMANDLEAFSRDLLALADGRAIQLRHYDHASGKMSKPVRAASNDFIIASGLHALYLPILRERYDLKIYLDIDEGLRRFFKIRRDVHERKHPVERVLASLDQREPDALRFIRPQAQHADLQLSLQPIRPDLLASATAVPRMKVVVRTRQGYNERSLHRVLVGVCGLHVDLLLSVDGRDLQMSIEGETSEADIRMAARMLCPNMQEFLDIPACWHDGPLGIMQLVTLSHISHALAKRLIW